MRIIINCGHSGMLFGHYLTHGKQSPLVAPGVGIYEGEFNRAIGERLFHLLPGSELLTPGPCNVTQATRRKNVNWIAGLEDDVLLLSVHANAAGRSGWKDGASGARFFTRKRPWREARLGDYNKSVEVATAIDHMFRGASLIGSLPYGVRSLMEKNYGILKVKCASVLCEIGFMTCHNDAAFMASEDGRDIIAELISVPLQEYSN